MPETKIVRFDKAHASLVAGLDKITKNLKALNPNEDGVEFILQEMVTQAQNARDIAKDRRDREAEPYDGPLKEIRARWKPVVDGFDGLVTRIKAVAADVLRRKREEQARSRREAEARLEAARAAEREREVRERQGKPAANLPARTDSLSELRDARAALDSLPPEGAPIGIKTETGTLSGREVWKWEVLEVKDVPDAYCQRLVEPNKVDLAIKNGVREIPGIRIYKDIEMVSRRAR